MAAGIARGSRTTGQRTCKRGMAVPSVRWSTHASAFPWP